MRFYKAAKPSLPLPQVHFAFPEPTELPPPLIQLNDVSFKYPGRDDFGLEDLNIGIVRHYHVLHDDLPCVC